MSNFQKSNTIFSVKIGEEEREYDDTKDIKLNFSQNDALVPGKLSCYLTYIECSVVNEKIKVKSCFVGSTFTGSVQDLLKKMNEDDSSKDCN
jgi:hypothetical protein